LNSRLFLGRPVPVFLLFGLSIKHIILNPLKFLYTPLIFFGALFINTKIAKMSRFFGKNFYGIYRAEILD
jgi:hypothetical protein